MAIHAPSCDLLLIGGAVVTVDDGVGDGHELEIVGRGDDAAVGSGARLQLFLHLGRHERSRDHDRVQIRKPRLQSFHRRPRRHDVRQPQGQAIDEQRPAGRRLALKRRLVERSHHVAVRPDALGDWNVVLRVSLEENLAMIRETVAFLRESGRDVIYDAEHFFDGWKANPEYARKTIQAAVEGGAMIVVMCDTNGGSMPEEIAAITKEAAAQVDKPLGIHTHNDSDLAVANSLAAIDAGAVHVQGTINGLGERCGNADLISVVANLALKKEGYEVLTADEPGPHPLWGGRPCALQVASSIAWKFRGLLLWSRITS